MRSGRARAALALALGLGCGLCGVAAGQGLPVIDPANLIQATLQVQRMAEQIDQMAQAYAKQIEELRVATEQRDAMLGARGLGELLNGPKERAARRPAPATVEELLRAVTTGQQIPASFEELRAIQERIRRELPLAGVAEVYGKSADTATGRAYDRSQRTAVANLALAEKSYHDAAGRVETYERLLAEIDRTPDLKASTDLVARLLVENGVATNELIRLNALLLAGAASDQAGALAARANLSGVATTRDAEAPARPRVEDAPVFRGVLR